MKINFLLEETKRNLEKTKKNINKGVKINKKWENKKGDLEILDLAVGMLENTKAFFIKDTHYKEGKIRVKKCVRNAFNELKYQKKLREYLKIKKQKINNSIEDNLNFECYEGLNEDLNVLEDMFDLITQSISVVKEDIEKETYTSVDLLAVTTTLISRLAQLYNIYGYYLEDIDGLAQYTVIYTMLQNLIMLLEKIFKKLKGDGFNE